jgi:hypothetical protein
MYNSIESIDTALNNRPHVIDGKQVDPKRAVPLEVCTIDVFSDFLKASSVLSSE